MTSRTPLGTAQAASGSLHRDNRLSPHPWGSARVHTVVVWPACRSRSRSCERWFFPMDFVSILRDRVRARVRFYVLQLRFIVYFGCAFLFVKSFRGEILDRSLHYTLLAPVRRDVLTVGKYLGALASTWALLLPSTAALVTAFYWAHGLDRGLAALVSGRGIAHLAAYLAATALACIGYGALFFLAGLFFRNPMVPAAAYLGFEVLAPFMPAVLRLFSVAQHLRAVLPVPISLGPMSAVGSPTPAPVAALLLLVVAILAVGLAAWKARRLEIEY